MWSCVLCKTTLAETGFHIPHSLSYVFRIPKRRIPDPMSKNFPNSGLYKEKVSRFRIVHKKFPGFRNEQAQIFPIPDCTGKNWRIDLLFQTLRNRFILNRLYIYNLYPWRLTAIILSVSGMTRSPTRAPTISPPWHFCFKQNRGRCQKKCFYLKNKLDS